MSAELLNRFPDAVKRGSYYVATCPACGSPESLFISQDDISCAEGCVSQVIMRKIPEPKNQEPIIAEHGCMYWSDRQISDCTVEVICAVKQPSSTVPGMKLYTRWTNSKKGVTGEGVVAMEELESESKANSIAGKFCLGWLTLDKKNGSLRDFKKYLMDRAISVAEPVNHVGYQPDSGVIIGTPWCIDAKNNYVKLSKPFTVLRGADNKEHRFLTTNIETFGEDIPRIRPTTATVNDFRTLAKRFISASKDNIGTYAAAMCLGYYVAYMADAQNPEEIDGEVPFPHLYLTGRSQCGKDTLADVIQTIFGIPRGAVLGAGRSSSPKQVRNQLTKSLGWPLWINELRNNQECEPYQSLVRTSFDRQRNSILRVDQSELSFKPVRSMLLSGEEILGERAEITRYVVMRITPPTNPKSLDLVQELAQELATMTPAIYLEIGKSVPYMQKVIKLWRTRLAAMNCDARRRRHWAWVASGISWLYTDDAEQAMSDGAAPESVMQELCGRAVDNMQLSIEDSIMTSFWDSLELQVGRDSWWNNNQDIFSTHMVDDRAVYCIAVGKLMAYMQDRVKIKTQKRLILNELRAIPGFVESGRPLSIRGSRTRCMVFSMRNSLPEFVAKLCSEVNASAAADDDETPQEHDSDDTRDQQKDLF